MRDERDDQASAEVAEGYRAEQRTFKERASELRSQAHALEVTAADMGSLAASIERDLRGIDPLPPAGL
jgi:hypothetical protein